MALSPFPVGSDGCQIDGVSFSHLVTNHCVTRGRFAKLLAGLGVIHAAINGTAGSVDDPNGESEYHIYVRRLPECQVYFRCVCAFVRSQDAALAFRFSGLSIYDNPQFHSNC